MSSKATSTTAKTGTSGTSGSWISDGPPSVPGPATVDSGFNALNPADGLFLRAEHLQMMQRYARDLAWAAGIGSGTGTVYGFEVEMDADATALTIRPGLAMSPVGQPLRSVKAAVIALKQDELPALPPVDGFWVVEVNPAWWTWGNENVYGNLCDEPCDGVGSLAPWVAEGITIALRADAIAGLSAVSAERRRNWLASKYFERERRAGGPWVTPRDNGGQVSPITAHDWATGGGPPVRAGVPIAVLQLVDGQWLLDVWTARRDIGAPPADDVWRRRLGMRPWNVFLAHVLQFQAQLGPIPVPQQKVQQGKAERTERAEGVAAEETASETEPAAAAVEADAESEDKLAVAERFFSEIESASKAPPMAVIRKAVEAWKQAPPPPVPMLPRSLSDMGFDELPSAGLLDVTGVDDIEARVAEFFGDGVDVRFCHVRADYVPHAMEEAQHLDRIPLASEYGKAAVDILVPDVATDFGPTRVASEYGWAAFVRRREADCGEPVVAEPVDVVDVYWAELDHEALHNSMKEPKSLLGRAKLIGQVEYPAGGWAYPGGQVAEEFMQLAAGSQASQIAAVALVAEDGRRPLGALRASLLVTSLDGGLPAPPVWAITFADAPESMVVVKTNPPQIG